MKAKEILVALAICTTGLTSSYASTNETFPLGLLSLDSNGFFVQNTGRAYFYGDSSDSYSFQDTYNFSLNAPFQGFANAVSNWGITSWSATLNGRALALTSGANAGSLSGNAAFISGVNSLVISGVTGSGGGSYQYNIGGSVAAVPEPEAFAMLLAGLGLVGAIARRRNKKMNMA